MKHLTPAYIAEYVVRLKWLEENPVCVTVSEQLHMTYKERKASNKSR